MALNAKLLQDSLQAVAPRGAELTERFYAILFERYPQVKPLFEGLEMQAQGARLLDSIVTIVSNVEKTDVLIPYLQKLGVRHVEYGAVAAHYDAVGECLLAALAEIAGEVWNDEFQSAWTEAYGVIASVMKDAAAAAGDAPSAVAA